MSDQDLAQAPLRVLVVEDDTDPARRLTVELREVELIGGRPTRVTETSDLEEALALLRDDGADLVLLDLGLSDAAGLDTVFEVTDRAPAVPVVVVSGTDAEELGERALLAGAQDLLVKGSFSGTELTRRLRFTLARHRHALEMMTARAQRHDEEHLTRLESLGAAGVGVASRSLGRVTLAETYPEAFSAAVDHYSELVSSRIEERGLDVDYQVSSRTRAVAWDLGHLRATPRDVVDVHLQALRALTEGKLRPRANALYRSGEALLTETLGHLASFYRAQLLGRSASRRGDETEQFDQREDPA